MQKLVELIQQIQKLLIQEKEGGTRFFYSDILLKPEDFKNSPQQKIAPPLQKNDKENLKLQDKGEVSKKMETISKVSITTLSSFNLEPISITQTPTFQEIENLYQKIDKPKKNKEKVAIVLLSADQGETLGFHKKIVEAIHTNIVHAKLVKFQKNLWKEHLYFDAPLLLIPLKELIYSCYSTVQVHQTISYKNSLLLPLADYEDYQKNPALKMDLWKFLKSFKYDKLP